MIYTVTCNPSLDYIVSVREFQAGHFNRTEQENILPGGKGINVSIVLDQLGIETTILGFVAGFTGQEIKSRLVKMGLYQELLTLEKGWSRINIKLRSQEESEINGKGPEVATSVFEKLAQQVERLTPEDVLVLSGSIPPSWADTVYAKLARQMETKGVPVVVDAEKALLMNTLPYHPFLVKPNRSELETLFQEKIDSVEKTIAYAGKLQQLGARNVLVSRAEEGAVLLTEEGKVFAGNAPKGRVVNSVGAGDSMVAGFLAGYLREKSLKEAFIMGIAAGSASAFSEGLATREEIYQVRRGIEHVD